MCYTCDEWMLSVKFIAALSATGHYLNYPASMTGKRVPLYAVKAQLIPMVSDMLEFTLKKWRLYGCFSLESTTFVAVTIKVIANEVKV